MSLTVSILVAHSSDRERGELESALFEAGYDVITATTGEEAMRSTAGINPKLLVTDMNLPEMTATELYVRLRATGLALPPFLIMHDGDAELPDVPKGAALYFVSVDGLSTDRLVQMVRLLVLAGDVDGEFGECLDAMHGDLSRVSFEQLMHALQKHVITGKMTFSVTTDTGLWMVDGEVVDAWWGELRGQKAFNRLAGLPLGPFVFTLEQTDTQRTIDVDVSTLVADAAVERLGVEEALAELPSLDSRPDVKLVQTFFSLEFSLVERQTMARAQNVTTLRELVDQVPATDFEVLDAVRTLRQHGIVELNEPAAHVHVVTDSTADLPPAEARRLGVSVVGVSIVFEGEVFQDGIDLTPEDFHRKLEDSSRLPVTSPATRGQFLETYRDLITAGDVASIHSSSKLSGCYDNAAAAAAEGEAEFGDMRREAKVPKQPVVRVVDSGLASGSLGLLVVAAARLARRGLSAEDIADKVADLSRRVRTVLVVDSLEFIRHAGALDGGQPVRGKSGAKRQILVLDRGQPEVAESADAAVAHDRLLDVLGLGLDPDRPLLVSLAHASAPAEAAQVREALQARYDIRELMEHQMGPAVTSHLGPGTVGVGVLQPTDDELEVLLDEEAVSS